MNTGCAPRCGILPEPLISLSARTLFPEHTFCERAAGAAGPMRGVGCGRVHSTGHGLAEQGRSALPFFVRAAARVGTPNGRPRRPAGPMRGVGCRRVHSTGHGLAERGRSALPFLLRAGARVATPNGRPRRPARPMRGVGCGGVLSPEHAFGERAARRYLFLPSLPSCIHRLAGSKRETVEEVKG